MADIPATQAEMNMVAVADYFEDHDGEVWWSIPSLPVYELSSDLRIRSWAPIGRRRTRPEAPRIICLQVDKNGYVRFQTQINGKRKYCSLHHIVAEVAYGEMSSRGNQIRHLDDNKINNWTSNIACGTARDNVADSIRNGTRATGMPPSSGKLSPADVEDIRDRLGAGERPAAIARRYSVSRQSICNIKTGSTWKQAV